MSDHRDAVVEHLAADELAAVDYAGTWREIARVALDRLYCQDVEVKRLRGRVADLCRQLRQRTTPSRVPATVGRPGL